MGSDIQKRWGCGRADLMKFDADVPFIVTDPKQRLCDPISNDKSITEEKIANMRRLGQLKPILVWLEENEKDPEKPGRVIVADGRQRLRTIREVNKLRKKAGEPPLPVYAVPYKGDDPEEAMYAANSIVETDDAFTKARKVKRFLDKHTEADTLVVFGFTRQTLSNLTALVEKATPAVQKLVAKGELTASAGYVVAKLPPEKQEEFATRVSSTAADAKAEVKALPPASATKALPAASASDDSAPAADTSTKAASAEASPAAPKPLKGRALQRAVDEARGKRTPSQRARSVKEWKEMQRRAESSGLPAPALALIDWALGDDDAMTSYLATEEAPSGVRRRGEETDGHGSKKSAGGKRR